MRESAIGFFKVVSREITKNYSPRLFCFFSQGPKYESVRGIELGELSPALSVWACPGDHVK